MSQKLTVLNKGKGKLGNIHTHLRQSFTCKGFLSSSESKTLEKYNSQYPSANDLVQQLLAISNNMISTLTSPCPCNTFGIKRKLTSVRNPQQ